MDYRVISTKMHGVLDYLMGAGLIGFGSFLKTNSRAAKVVPIVLGASTIAYSLITDYELSIKRMLSMKTHLGIDAGSALFLAAAPLAFKFSKNTWLGHVLLAACEMAAVALTQTKVSMESRALISDFLLHNKLFGKPVHPAKIKPRKLELA